MYTFGELKTSTRERIWPSGESDRLVTAHDKMFVDAMMDLQTWVKCLQQDHTDIVPHCATYFNCGLTVLDAPRGRILKVSVIDKIDPDTLEEDPTADDDYCQEIVYDQVNPCYIQSYLSASQARGCCLSIPLFFSLPYSGCGHAAYPAPTDEGLPAGLPILPLGYHYPQTSTDATQRSFYGVWAIERGKLYVAPWIQSTESVILKWDGLKRTWADQDPCDPDPQLATAVEEYVRWQHASKYDRDEAEATRASGAFNLARQMLIHECREETRTRGCESSQARGGSLQFGTLFYNDQQQVTLTCPSGQTGTPVTVTIAAGTVGSNVSVSDANRIAQQQAQAQAEAQLVCTDIPVTYTNNVPGDFTASCVSSDEDAPTPTGSPVRIIKPVGTVEGSTQAEANSNAQQEAQTEAYAALAGQCTYHNSPQTATIYCASNPATAPISVTCPANSYHATDQTTANQLAMNWARADAQAQMAAVCAGDYTDGGGSVVYNTARQTTVTGTVDVPVLVNNHIISVTVKTLSIQAHMPASTVSGASLIEANTEADAQLQVWANNVKAVFSDYIRARGSDNCTGTTCVFIVKYPTIPFPPGNNYP